MYKLQTKNLKKKKQNKAEVEENTQLTFWKEKSKDQGTN